MRTVTSTFTLSDLTCCTMGRLHPPPCEQRISSWSEMAACFKRTAAANGAPTVPVEHTSSSTCILGWRWLTNPDLQLTPCWEETTERCCISEWEIHSNPSPPQRRGCIGTTSQPEPWCPETQAPCKTGYERVPSKCSGDTGRLSCHRNDASVSQHLLNTTAVPCGSENGSVRAICGWNQCVQTCSNVNRQSQPHLHRCRCRNHLAIHRKPLAFVPLRCHQ